MSDPAPFKTCPMCSRQWDARKEFIADPTIELSGYMADFESMESVLLCFTHLLDHCGTTLAIEAGAFLDLYTGERYAQRQFGQSSCSGRCLDKEDLEQCDAHCEYAAVRAVMQIIRAQKLHQAQAA